MVRTHALTAAIWLVVAAVENAAVVPFHCTWSDPLVVLEETNALLWVQHYRNPALHTLTIRARITTSLDDTRVSSLPGWMGIGINLQDNDWIAHSVTVIGRQLSTTTGDATVGWYEIVNDAKDGSGVLALSSTNDEQPPLLTDATFQTVDDTTLTLKFTMPLHNAGWLPVSISDNSTWIFAAGDLSDDGGWAEGQYRFASFQLTLQDRCTPVSNTDPGDNKEEDGQQPTDHSESGNSNGESEPSNGPLPPFPSSPSSVTPSQSGTIHTVARKVHQWTMVVAWGVAAPLAIGASLARRLFPSAVDDNEGRFKPMWYKCHLIFGALCLALTAFGMVVLALVPVVASNPIVQLVPDTNQSLQNHHRWIGYSLLMGLLAHTVASACHFGLRYVPPPPNRTNDNETEATRDESESSTTGVPSRQPSIHSQEENEGDTTAAVQVAIGFPAQTMGADETDCREPNALTTRRLEGRGTANKVIVHRLVGAVLVGLAWSACQTGYDFLGGTSWVFWMLVSIISALVLVTKANQYEGERLPGDY